MGTREHDKPLNPSEPSQERSDRNRAIKDEFDTAHQDGMAALKSGDLDALDDAIEREKSAINKHKALARSLKPKRR